MQIDQEMQETSLVPQTTHPTQFCHRHNPDIQRPKELVDRDAIMREKLGNLPVEQVEMIQQMWKMYSTLPANAREVVLEGVVQQSCLAQLSFMSNELDSLLRFDMIGIAPRELSLKIFSYLDAQSLCRAAAVSRTWKILADDDVLWHRLCEQHIDRKCGSCGWGLPLLDISKYRRRGNSFSCGSDDSKRRKVDKRIPRPWKEIYAERQAVERNWRSGTYNFKEIKDAHVGGVATMHFNDQVGLLATSGVSDNLIKVWSVATHALIATLEGHTGTVRALQITDKNNIISGSEDNTIKFWNYRTLACIRTLEGHTHNVLSLHFEHNLLVSGGADHTVRLWDFATGQAAVLQGHTDWVNCVRLYGRNQVFSCSDDQTIRQWDIVTKKVIRVYQGHHGSVESIRVTPPPHHLLHDTLIKDKDPKPVRLVSGGLDNLVLLWDVEDVNTPPRELFGHREGVWSVTFDSLRTFSCGQDGVVKVWDTDSGQLLHNLTTSGNQALHIVQTSDTTVFAAGESGNVYEWSFDETVDWSERLRRENS